MKIDRQGHADFRIRVARFAIRCAILAAIGLCLSVVYLSSSAFSQGRKRATLVGVVLPSHARRGTLVSGLMVVNPDDYEGIPGLKVVRTEIPVAKDSSEQTALREVSVDTGDGVKQRGDRPFTAKVAADGGVSLAIAGSQQGAERIRATVENATTTAGVARGYAMPPVSSDSGVMVIHGAFAGDARRTAISLNGEPVKKLAETSDAVYFEVPQNVPPGRNQVELREGTRAASFDLFAPSLTIRAGQTTLKSGESTQFDVNLSGLAQLPASAWRAGTPSAELFDLSALREKAPALSETPSGKDGALVLLIENKSPQTVDMAPNNTVAISLTRSDLKDGSYDYRGTLTATESGTFELEATLVPMLTETVAETAVAAQTETGAMSNNAESAGDCDNKWIKDETIASSGGRPGLDQLVQERAKELEDKFGCSSKQCSGDSAQKCVFKTSTYNLQALPGGRGEWAEGVRFGCFCKAGAGVGTGSRKPTATPTIKYETPVPTPEPTETEIGLPPPVLPTSVERQPTPYPTSVESETPNPTPTEFPTVIESYSPTPHPTPTVIGCPQLNRGCAALVIDIMQNNDYIMADAHRVPPVIKNAGCVVDYVTPDFWRIPHPITFGVTLYTPSQQKVDDALAHNDAEWARVERAIDTHSERVAAGKNLAIEIVNAHGAPPRDGSTSLLCGYWTANFHSGQVLSRNDLIGKMYGAAKANVCSWVMYDSSCYSGYTPMAMDEAENEPMMLGIPVCSSASVVNCPRHAGYGLDTAAGASIASKQAINGGMMVDMSSLKSALGSAEPRDFSELGKALGGFTSGRNSNYSDQGYEGDIPPPHQHPHSGY